MRDERPEQPDTPQLFRYVKEHADESSTTLADGVEWPDGTVSVHWRGKYPVTEFWRSIDNARAVHCSGPEYGFINSERNWHGSLH